MTPKQTLWFLIVATLVLLIAAGVVAQLSPLPIVKDAATILAITTAVSVGIERFIETFWTIIGLTLGTGWPSGGLKKQFDQLMADLDTALQPFYQQVEQAIHNAASTDHWTDDKLEAAKKELDDLQAGLYQLKGHLPPDQRAKAIIESASQSIAYLQGKYPLAKATLILADQNLSAFSSLVDSFKDNIARRLISLYIGCIAGLAIAGILGLDFLQAIFTTTTPSTFWLLPHLGVALTGLLMGLGSNPTHEIIRAVQEYKRTLKIQNATSGDQANT